MYTCLNLSSTWTRRNLLPKIVVCKPISSKLVRKSFCKLLFPLTFRYTLVVEAWCFAKCRPRGRLRGCLKAWDGVYLSDLLPTISEHWWLRTHPNVYIYQSAYARLSAKQNVCRWATSTGAMVLSSGKRLPAHAGNLLPSIEYLQLMAVRFRHDPLGRKMSSSQFHSARLNLKGHLCTLTEFQAKRNFRFPSQRSIVAMEVFDENWTFEVFYLHCEFEQYTELGDENAKPAQTTRNTYAARSYYVSLLL